jgi:hypothetical protein
VLSPPAVLRAAGRTRTRVSFYHPLDGVPRTSWQNEHFRACGSATPGCLARIKTPPCNSTCSSKRGASACSPTNSAALRPIGPGLKEVLSHLREADTLVVWKLDRLGRSVKRVGRSGQRDAKPVRPSPELDRWHRHQNAGGPVFLSRGGLIVRMDIQDVGTEDRVPIQAQVPE